MKTVAENRVSHAQLFYGPEGSGKLALAIAYAQYICCTSRLMPSPENNFQGDSCGQCPSCLKYEKLIHPDLHFYYPIVAKKDEKKVISKDYLSDWRKFLIQSDLFISVNNWYEYIAIENKQGIINAEDCNEMIRTLALKPYESEYKMLIIWMVEKLYYAAAPKILKVLEEPPPKTLFLLVCENHDQVLNTIISRTQLVKVHKFDPLALSKYLIQNFQASEESVKRILPLANGNIIEAIGLIRSSEDEKRNYQNFRQLLQFCYKNEIKSISESVDSIASGGREQIKSFLNFGIRAIRNTMLRNTGNSALVRLEGEELEFINNLSKVIKPEAALAFTDELNRSVYHIERNGAPKIVLFDMCLTFIDFFKRFR